MPMHPPPAAGGQYGRAPSACAGPGRSRPYSAATSLASGADIVLVSKNTFFICPLCFQTPRPLAHSVTSASETLEANRVPVCQSPVPAISASSSPLSPRPELEEARKGITVLPVKSLFFTKSLTGQAAMPHQMG